MWPKTGFCGKFSLIFKNKIFILKKHNGRLFFKCWTRLVARAAAKARAAVDAARMRDARDMRWARYLCAREICVCVRDLCAREICAREIVVRARDLCT